MSDEITYSSYLSKIKKLEKALENHSWKRDIFFSKFQEIMNIFLKKGITACADLLDPSLIKKINSSFPCYKGTVIKLYKHIFNTLNFKGNFSKKKREEFFLENFKFQKEREPTKREKLFDKIIPLYYQYNNYLNNKMQKDYFLNAFVQEIGEIKTLYFQIRKEGIDNDNHIYDQFDKEFYKRYITLFDFIADKFCLKEKIIKRNNLELVKGIPLKMRTFFYEKEKLIYGEDNQIEYKDFSFPFSKELKEEIKKQICGFLNSQGGRIFIGISDDKIVNGILINYHQRDAISNEIVNLTYDFYPKCRTYIDVNFIPIKNINDKYIEDLFIIKIIISRGEPKQLYSCTTKGFNSYLRLKGQCICLTAEEIKYELLKREKNSDFQINPKEFKDPIPENPELIKSNEILNEKNVEYEKNIDGKGNMYKKENEDNCDYDEDNLEENEDDYEENDEEENEDNYEENGEKKKEYDYEENDIEKNEDSYDYGEDDEEEEEENEDDEVEDNEDNSENNFNIYPIKINVAPLTNKSLTKQNLKTIFSSANCKKKFFKEGKKFYGYLNFTKKLDAILFQKKFNYNAYSDYRIKLIPKF